MSWPVSNARVEPKAHAIAIEKQVPGTAKIYR
jgi:phage terminase large subunit-like protein